MEGFHSNLCPYNIKLSHERGKMENEKDFYICYSFCLKLFFNFLNLN